MHVIVYSKAAGTQHKDDGNWNEYSPSNWKDDENSDIHTLTIPLDENKVYKIAINNPVDKANNSGTFDEKSLSNIQLFLKTDYEAPKLDSRNGSSETENLANSFIDNIYDLEQVKQFDAPNMIFEDTNIDYVEYDLLKYIPEKMILLLQFPITKKLKTLMEDDTKKIQFTLPDFKHDGVYYVKIWAYDKAENMSELYVSTYIRMVNTEVLAYLESDKENKNGFILH